MGRAALIIALAMLLAPVSLGPPQVAANLPGQPAARRPAFELGNLPLRFEPIAAPTGETTAFVARAPGCAYMLTPQSLSIRGSAREIRVRFAGAETGARLIGSERLPHKTNYISGQDPSAWRTGVPSFARVMASGLYPGIEIQYYGSRRELEFDLLVAPHADLSAAQLVFEGVESIVHGRDGELRLHSGDEDTILRRPVAFQQEAGARRPVKVEYAVGPGKSARFTVGSYDPELPLILDPVLSFSTHLGGGGEFARAVAVDISGNIYIAGETPSILFPTKNALQPSFGGLVDVFVAKISGSGSGLVYSTYIGGSGDDRAQAIAVDNFGNAYVTGSTRSTNFPIRGAIQGRIGGGSFGDAFAAKLSADGASLLYSTYLGGDDEDSGNGIAVDASGAACIVGTSRSRNFPTRFALQAGNVGLDDVVVARLSPDGSQLLFSTYLGGSDSDSGRGIALDGSGHALITGTTASTNFPLRNPLQRTLSGASSPFVAKLNIASPALVYCTYLGSGEGNAIAADSLGYAYVTGQTSSTVFPTVNPSQSLYGGGGADAFISKIDPAGSGLVYSTYLGGLNADIGYGIALDSAGNAYVAGSTSSYNFPSKNPLQASLRGVDDAFLAQLDASGSNLLFATFFGGSGSDQAFGLAVDRSGNIYAAGATYSFDFPLLNALKPNLTGFVDAFLVKLAPDTPLRDFVYFPQFAIGGGYSTVFTLTNTGAATATGTLSLADKAGRPLSAVVSAAGQRDIQGTSFSISVAGGASAILTTSPLDASGAQQTGWAFVDTTGGRLSGVATFRRKDGSVIKSLAGVLASPPTEFADIPVDNDDTRQRYTGFALANPGSEPVNVQIVTLDGSGKALDIISPAELNPLAAGGQASRFLHELLPARSRFRGSMTLLAEGGKRIVVVALVQDRGLFTAIPVILAKAPGL